MSYEAINIYRSENLTLGAASVSAPAVSTGASALRVVSTVDAWVSLSGPAQVGAGFYLPTGHVEYLVALPGTVISAIPDDGTVGTMNVSEIG